MGLEKNPRSLVFYMAYPGPGNLDGASRSLIDPDYLLRHLDAFLQDQRFQCVEVTSLKSRTLRQQVAQRLRNSGKRIAFHCQPVQWTNEENLIDPADLSSLSQIHRQRAIERIIRLMDEAAEYSAEAVFLASGRNPASGQPYDSASAAIEQQAEQALLVSLRHLAVQARQRKMKLILSVGDRGSPDPGTWRHQLVGPVARAVALIETLRGEGYDHVGLALESGVLRLNHENAQALAHAAPFLMWFHVSNAVGAEGEAQRRGATYPRFGVPGSLVQADDLTEFLRTLAELSYTGPLSIAVRPVGREVPGHVISVAYALLEQAAADLEVISALPLGFAFRARDFLTEETFAEITKLRVEKPELILEELRNRRKRSVLAPDGRLVILAADHPARGVTRVGTHPTAMGHRLDYLSRIVRCLMVSEIDGLMATSDVIDDVVLVNYMVRQKTGRSFLENRVLIGSMNRTGLAGTEHEMMDRPSSYMTGKRIKEMNLDGGKLLWRWVPGGEKNDRYALETLERVARAVEELADLGLAAFVEPLPVQKTESGYRTDLHPDNIIKAVGIASALGYYSGRLWLKIPYCEDFARVAKATTLPVLLLGGEATGKPVLTVLDMERGLGAGPNIRGCLIGRNVLFCGEDDPAVIAQAIHYVVHQRLSTHEAISRAANLRHKCPSLLAPEAQPAAS
ncbi:MAG: TIM barrel protein [Gemmatales bacterium]|nr:TIM barrel protein [Gemmatales bacterium]MDW8221439.1 TIM barrel protein [Gemmatales bacterium]